MDMTITFPGDLRVDAQFGTHTVPTDQTVRGGGAATAPTPFDTFLASIGTCAGLYVLAFCRQRNLPTEGIRIAQHTEIDPKSGFMQTIRLDIHVPQDFPPKYYEALVRAADQCKVKRHLEHPPTFEVRTRRR